MKRFILFVIVLACSSACAHAQDTTRISREQSMQLIKRIGMDSTTLLKRAADQACKCIDSAVKLIVTNSGKLNAVAGCIDQQVEHYEMSMKLLSAVGNDTYTIAISEKNEDSPEYQHYYFEIERRLKDSCQAMNDAIKSNDEAGDLSYSNNKRARAAYDDGVAALNKEDYATGIKFFKKGVVIDPKFAFAWDNLGICYRQAGDYEKAEKAYKASLKLVPSGKTPLQNLPRVYVYQQKYQQAIDAYKEMLKFYPEDAEVYYGIGLVYFDNIKDMEASLENMCKAYNIYIAEKSPFRADAEKVINLIYQQFKKDNKEEVFTRILKENNISVN